MRYLTFLLPVFMCLAFVPQFRQTQTVTGAWMAREKGITHVITVADNYLSLTGYDTEGRKFLYTMGGPVRVHNDEWQVSCEYHTQDSTRVGTQLQLPLRLNKDRLTAEKASIYNGMALPLTWTHLDQGSSALTGNWRITQRMQDGKLQTIHQSGTRKTVKLLTGSRFQWVAIDPGVKGFYGTGGGTYTFEKGKYTEHIEFFSRDSSRVGASLSFAGKLKEGNWHHSGKSSRGDNIYEVWSRK